MAKYKRFLIQQQTVSEGNYTNVGKVIDTQEAFHVVCQSFPFKHLPETKELPKRDWYDEHGEDVYMPSDGQRFKAYDVDAKFIYVGTETNMKTELKNFINFLYGRNENGSPRLAVYDEYTKTGRRGVHVSEVNNELLAYDNANKDVIGAFTIRFRVTDPTTSITLSTTTQQ